MRERPRTPCAPPPCCERAIHSSPRSPVAPPSGSGGPVKYYRSILETIGNTPLVKLNKVVGDAKPLVLAKLEVLNPGASVKDPLAPAVVEPATGSGGPVKYYRSILETIGNTPLVKLNKVVGDANR